MLVLTCNLVGNNREPVTDAIAITDELYKSLDSKTFYFLARQMQAKLFENYWLVTNAFGKGVSDEQANKRRVDNRGIDNASPVASTAKGRTEQLSVGSD